MFIFSTVIVEHPLNAENYLLVEKSNEIVSKELDFDGNQYLLDSGDILFIDFFGIDIFTNNYIIDRDGNINLPEIGFLNVKDKTINELEISLMNLYESIIIKPNIKISISSYRPVTVFLGGEVNRPGLYTLNYIENKNISSIPSYSVNDRNNSKNKLNSNSFISPKLFDAMQKGMGITSNADISKIKVIRKNKIQDSVGMIKTNINLLSLLEEGYQDQNITLFDGDSIFVPRSEDIVLDQMLAINRTNLTPEIIEVFVNGNIAKPGRTQILQNSSLLEALASVGGKLPNTGKIHFIRLKRDGKTEKRILNYSETANKGSLNNPILLNGDIIIVKRNILGQTKQSIDNIASPVLSGYGLYKLFD